MTRGRRFLHVLLLVLVVAGLPLRAGSAWACAGQGVAGHGHGQVTGAAGDRPMTGLGDAGHEGHEGHVGHMGHDGHDGHDGHAGHAGHHGAAAGTDAAPVADGDVAVSGACAGSMPCCAAGAPAPEPAVLGPGAAACAPLAFRAVHYAAPPSAGLDRPPKPAAG